MTKLETSQYFDDGWNDAAAESTECMIKGTLLQFADGKWYMGKERTSLEGTRLLPMYTKAAWVRRSNGKPVECIIRQVGQELPERDELGDLDIGYWETGTGGQPKDCWHNTRFVYFKHPTVNSERYTFVTSSFDGRSAVSDLALQIIRARYTRPGALPVVELCTAPPMLGGKSKPLFKIGDWPFDKALNDKPEFFRKASSPAKTATEEILEDDFPW
jgi:hypothetical protein